MSDIKVGLEIHGYLNITNRSKLFCNCKIEKDAEPNTNICPTCTSQPGSKPMAPNKEALDKIIAIGLMLDCKINQKLLFQRKHYSWPDLPSGYQRTISGSYATPVGVHGEFLGIGIEEVHLEEDPAKWDPETGYIDYNRSGYPLVEMVTKPDFKNSEDVKTWIKKLLTMLEYIKAVNPDLGIKCDVNVSVAPDFIRVEIKNVNSIRSIGLAIEHEAARQRKSITDGKNIEMQTRTWSDEHSETIFMRKKEQAMDYMFIPEQDLPLIELDNKEIKKIEDSLPEKPHEKKQRYIKMHVEKTDAEIISSDIVLAELFEKVAKKIEPCTAAKWMRREILRVLNFNKKELSETKIDANHIIDLLTLSEQKRITEGTAKKILERLVDDSLDIEKYVKSEGLEQIADQGEIDKICSDVIKYNQKAVEDYKNGQEKSLNFLVGQVMGKSKGRIDAQTAKELILKQIN